MVAGPTPTTHSCLGAVSSDFGLQSEDVNGLIREAEPIFLCFCYRSSFDETELCGVGVDSIRF